jgi:hypothetical protein
MWKSKFYELQINSDSEGGELGQGTCDAFTRK